jgi:hypothetical protein
VAGDHVLLGGNQQYSQEPSVTRVLLVDHAEVQLGLVDRDRQVVAGLIGDRAAQLLRLHPGKIDQPDDHPLVGHAEDHPVGTQPGSAPERLDRRRHRRRVSHRTVDDGAGRQLGLPDALELGLAAVGGQLSRAYRGGADVETDDVSGH